MRTNLKQINVNLIKQKDIDRFWQGVNKTETCWLWTRSVTADGHALFYIGMPEQKTCYLIHRLSYYFHYKIDPYPHLVLHKCDVANCVNPEHLYLGNDTQNVNDMISKDRFHSKLRIEDIDKIKQLYSEGYTQHTIADMYVVNQSTIGRILSGKRWKHLL